MTYSATSDRGTKAGEGLGLRLHRRRENVVPLARGALVLVFASWLSSCGPNLSETAVMYYRESQQVEPWAASGTGTLPNGWQEQALRDMQQAALHPLLIETIETAPASAQTCVDAGCSNRHALRVVLPRAEVDRAGRRCFDTSLEAVGTLPALRQDCQPLYRAR